MSTNPRLRALFALFAALALGGSPWRPAVTTNSRASSGSADTGGTTSDNAILSNPDNGSVNLTVGSKNFKEEIISARSTPRASRPPVTTSRPISTSAPSRSP